MSLWRELTNLASSRQLTPSDLRELAVFGGAQGIWVDKNRTSDLAEDGVTVSVLHTGSSYDDNLTDDNILYHYPKTRRPPSRDLSEINATKNAHQLGLPLFVITYPAPSSKYRNVHLAWVEDWDDQAEVFLITFGESPPAPKIPIDEQTPFELTSSSPTRRREQKARSGQTRFHRSAYLFSRQWHH